MKKALAVLLSAAMILGLAACGSTAQEAATTAAAAETTVAATTAAATTAAAAQAATTAAAAETTAAAAESEIPAWKVEHPTWITEEKSEITVTTYDGVTDAYLPPSDDVYFWQFVEKMTNVHVIWDVNPYTSYNEIIRAKLSAAEDLSDVIVINNDGNLAGTLASLGENGVIVDLKPYWDTNFKYTKAYWEEHDELPYEKLATNADGTMWALRSNANAENNRITALWNKNWMDRLGLEVPETIDEFDAVMKAFKEAGDLNGNGEADEIMLTTADMSYLLPYFGAAFDVHEYEDNEYSNYWLGSDGKMFDERISEPMKNTLTYLNKLYTEGILDPEVLSMNYDFQACTEKGTLGRYGCIIMYYSFSKSYGKLLNKYYIEGWDDSMLKDVPGVYIGTGLASPYNGNKIQHFKNQDLGTAAVATVGDKQDIAMQWMDFVHAAPESLRERCYGPEGIGYELDANGEPQLKYDADGNWISLNEYGCGQIAMTLIQTYEQLMNSSKHMKWFIDDTAKFKEKTEFFASPVPGIPTIQEEQDVIDMYVTDVATYWKEMRNKFVTGDAKIDAEWDKYVSTMKAMGADELTAAYQSMYDRTH